MKRPIAVADRLAGFSLKLILAANVLFLLSFLAIAFVATGQARAEAVACTGKDLLTELQVSDPALLAKIRDEGAKTLNGKGILWKVEKGGTAPSFLFGTMHVTDPRVIQLPPAAQKAFDASDTLVIETTDILDPQKMMAGLLAKPELMMFTDRTTLTSLIPQADLPAVEAALDARGIPLASVVKMKPWMLSAMIALPACEVSRKSGGAPVLDEKLAGDAKKSGKRVAGLETAASQIEAMASLPMDFHIKGLVETLKLGAQLDDVIETMIVLYEGGDTGLFWPLFRATLPGSQDASGYGDFEQIMVTARNHGMAENARPFLDKGAAFVAVGAMHLAGAEGLVELLRKAGYTVSPAEQEF